jgi:hypothetical protein
LLPRQAAACTRRAVPLGALSPPSGARRSRPVTETLLSPVPRSRALELGLLPRMPGKTPDATMASALYTDIKKGAKAKGASTFVRCGARMRTHARWPPAHARPYRRSGTAPHA